MRTDRKAPSGNTPKGRSSPARPRERGEPPRISLPPETELIAGRNAVRESLRAGKRVRRLLLAEGGVRDELVEETVRLARGLRVPVEEVSRERLDLLAPDHQGLAAVVGPFPYLGWGDLLERLRRVERPPALLLLDTLHDPQNLGTLLRTAEAVGVDAVILPRRRSVHATPSVVRSSAGASEHLDLVQVPNLPRAAAELKEVGVWVAGIDVEGDRPPWELDMTGPTALVLGGEDRGLGRLVKESCDFLVRLPMEGRVNSLNAATAGSIVLYEMVRQRYLKARRTGE